MALPVPGQINANTKGEQQHQQDEMFAAVQKNIADMISLYNDESSRNQSTNALILGEVGSGKSTLATSGRYPCLYDSFDPGGLKTKVIKERIKAGQVIPNTRFELEDIRKPTVYRLWEAEMKKRHKIKLFDHIGTYVLDLTKWGEAVASVVKQSLNQLETGVCNFTTWERLGTLITAEMQMLMALPCDVIVCSHIMYETDDVSHRTAAHPCIQSAAKTKIPIVFDEVWKMEVKGTTTATSYKVLTHNNGYFNCSTNLDLDIYEEPDLKAMLKKAGMPYEDLPLFNLPLTS